MTMPATNLTQQPLIEFNNVALGYGYPILNNISFAIYKGDFLGIVGPNGVGKTTFLKGVLGLLKPIQGEIIYNKDEVTFGYVPQRQVVDELFPLTVSDIVLMGRYRHIGFLRQPGKHDKEKVAECLLQVGIEDLTKKLYRELSGGQKQRVLLARALVREPSILLLDEPTTDMDLPSERGIMELIENLRSYKQLTILIVSHLLHVVINYANRLAFVGENKISVQDAIDALTPENLSSLYGVPVVVGEAGGKKFVL